MFSAILGVIAHGIGVIIGIMLLIKLVLWVIHDAEKRYGDGMYGVFWLILIFMSGYSFIPIYIIMRPEVQNG